MLSVTLLYVLLAGSLVAAASYFNINIISACKNYRAQITSFSAGIGVTYIFLQLFPEFVEKTIDFFHPAIFLSVLFGFILFFLAEKYVYQHYKNIALAKGLELEDSVISFIYHFIIGLVLVSLFSLNVQEGVLFFIPIFLNTAVHVLPLDIAPSKLVRGVVASATLIGVLVASFVFMPNPITITVLIGLVVGTLLFSVIRHSLPYGKEGKPSFFCVRCVAVMPSYLFQMDVAGIFSFRLNRSYLNL